LAQSETSPVIKAVVTTRTQTHFWGNVMDGWITTTAKRQTHLNPKAQSRTCGGGRGQRSARARKH